VVTSYLVRTPDISCGCRNRNAAADLTGRGFGALTVEGPAQRKGYWRVRCACGAQKEIRGDSLIQGRARTCGARCHQYQDVTGQRRGHLTALRPVGRLEGGSPVWLWRCDCGAEMEATLQSVPSRHNRMCPACLKKRNQGIIALAFQRKQDLAIDGLAPTTIRHILEGKLIASNTSGIRGVCLDQRTGKWIASGRENGRNVSLGHFDTAAEAECVRRQYVREKYGQTVLQRLAAGLANVEVEILDSLLVDFCRKRGARVVIRGVRVYSDFEYEFQMALTNRRMAPEIETLFMMPSENLAYVTASTVREIARYGGDTSPFVTPAVQRRLEEMKG
jgi:pantetheine-phosphate adenylyltransferase